MRTRDKKIPLALRSDASVRFSLFLKAWLPSTCNLKRYSGFEATEIQAGSKIVHLDKGKKIANSVLKLKLESAKQQS